MYLHNPELQNALVSKQSTLLSRKIVNRYKIYRLLCLMKMKTLVLWTLESDDVK